MSSESAPKVKIKSLAELSDVDQKFYAEAVRMAEKAEAEFEVPVGCVFVYEGEIIGRGNNEVNKRGNPTLHAEMVAIEEVNRWCEQRGREWKEIFPECTLYVNLEPCCMCASGLYQLRIPRCIYGAPNERFGGMCTVMSNDDYKHPHTMEIIANVDMERSVGMLKNFYKHENPFAPEELRKTKNKIPRKMHADGTGCMDVTDNGDSNGLDEDKPGPSSQA